MFQYSASVSTNPYRAGMNFGGVTGKTAHTSGAVTKSITRNVLRMRTYRPGNFR